MRLRRTTAFPYNFQLMHNFLRPKIEGSYFDCCSNLQIVADFFDSGNKAAETKFTHANFD